MLRLPLRLIACSAAVAITTITAHWLVPVNATTAGFAYLLLVLVIASTWGFVEAVCSSILATFCFNYFFLPPIGTLTITDPQNWVALFSFVATSLIASRLSTIATDHATKAFERQRDIERLYEFSRGILLTHGDEPLQDQIIRRLVEAFALKGAVLYDRDNDRFHRAGGHDLDLLDDDLKNVARGGRPQHNESAAAAVASVTLGSNPIASLAIEGATLSESVLQGVTSLVAIGLERARSQEFERQVAAARESERLRTALIDAVAHEFKTPLAVIKGVTSSLLAGIALEPVTVREQIAIADEEAEHLRELIDDSIELARLDTPHIETHREIGQLGKLVSEIVSGMQRRFEGRTITMSTEPELPFVPFDRRLIKLAVQQLIDNAFKYSPLDSSVRIWVGRRDNSVVVDVENGGSGIPAREQKRIFERFYRGEVVRGRIPGSGLGLPIAQSIVHAHGGQLTVRSEPEETTFRMTLPMLPEADERL